MGDLVAGQPALRIETAVSLPLDLISVLSLLYRAVPGSDLDPWLVDARRRLPDPVRADLDLLHGFSGRLLYYPEEPVMRFEPLRPDRLDASFDDLRAFMEAIPDDDYCDMVGHALERVYTDLEMRWRPPTDAESWSRALTPALTTTPLADVLVLIADPAQLKRRTIALYEGVWQAVYKQARAVELPMLRAAALRGSAFADRGFSEAYAALTGQRVPDVLERPPSTITRVAFCPSAHLGGFVSYIAYEPDLIVYFSAPHLIHRCQEREASASPLSETGRTEASDQIDLLDAARALADPTRLRMLDLLLEGELYAQEIVGRLGVAQSAVSRHLGQLERAGLVTVEARRGSKYYAVNPGKFEAVASALQERSDRARARAR
ncbi:MAG: transcriptional regulator, ArsR family [Thermomicrobiales bacterium]|jgi:DNA-binding transcriptional ArsR family regulator|nr:transcriptional regulator, ArsR family [Thermomicrobiales bacterium]